MPETENTSSRCADLRALAADFGIAYMERIEPDILDPQLVAGLPVEWARANFALPVRVLGELCVLVADPSQTSPQKDLALLLGEELKPILAPRAAILKSIGQCYYSKQNSASDFLKELPREAPHVAGAEARKTDDLLQVAEQAPITQLVNLILLEAVKARASDIHFEPFQERLRLRYRIDGILYEQPAPPKHMEHALVSRLKVMARMDIAEKRLPQDGMANVRVADRQIDIRVSTMPVAEGERVVLRLLDRDSSVLTLSELGMLDASTTSFAALLKEPHGLVLVSGPTGSGKTTTLYAALRQVDTAHKNVMTIEDPIEYQLPDIGQIQVKPKIGLTFARGLRHILRQEPDVVLVGETRDLETAEIAVRASLTGHLVFTTLHTNDAPSAAIRMLDMGVEPYLLAAALRAVLAQRLVRRVCPRCRVEDRPGREEVAALGKPGERLHGARIWRAKGCSECLGGYRGRMGLFEFMTVNSAMEQIIRTGQGSATRLAELQVSQGSPTLMDDGVEKILQGATTIEEVIQTAGHFSPGHR